MWKRTFTRACDLYLSPDSVMAHMLSLHFIKSSPVKEKLGVCWTVQKVFVQITEKTWVQIHPDAMWVFAYYIF